MWASFFHYTMVELEIKKLTLNIQIVSLNSRNIPVFTKKKRRNKKKVLITHWPSQIDRRFFAFLLIDPFVGKETS